MKISSINQIHFQKINSENKPQKENSQTENQKELSVYPRPYLPKFGQAQLEEFNPNILPNVGIDEEFSDEELKPTSGKVDLTDILELTYLAERIRYFDKTGELIPYLKNQVLDECKYKRLSPEETKQKVEEATRKFEDEINTRKSNATDAINTLSPTLKPHTVYRVISQGYSRESYEYFQKMKTIKAGDEVTLDTIPIYVSTSGEKTFKNYGHNHDNILFQINLPKGSKMLRFPSNDGIEQGIMKPNAKFKIIENKEYKNNFHHITLEYIPTEEEN